MALMMVDWRRRPAVHPEVHPANMMAVSDAGAACGGGSGAVSSIGGAAPEA
jgi:hypothetical protein